MQNSVFSRQLVESIVDELKITDLAQATIGQVVLLASALEQRTGIPFIRMDQGVPGLSPNQVGIAAEKAALDTGIAAIYPAAEGVPELKRETSRFVKAFLNVDITPEACIPTTGSVAGSFGSFIVTSQCSPGKDTVLFIDPGFPIQKSQLKILGVKYRQFDIFNYRGAALRDKLESFLKEGNISAIIYSNPNNPAWICLEEEELQIIGELATQYDTIVLEDLAYFAMDFRRDLSRPFEPPFQATVARYTDNYMLMLSASKIFSYAGQRMAVVCISDKLFNRRYPALAERYNGAGLFGNTFTNAIMYMITSGASHSVQFGLRRTDRFRGRHDGIRPAGGKDEAAFLRKRLSRRIRQGRRATDRRRILLHDRLPGNDFGRTDARTALLRDQLDHAEYHGQPAGRHPRLHVADDGRTVRHPRTATQSLQNRPPAVT